MSAMLCVRGLKKSYGNIHALDDLNLDIETGEVFGFLGPNGAGKTTAIECMLGLRQPDGGSILINGIDALSQTEKVKSIIGAQLQATALQDKITPREAVKFFGGFYKNPLPPMQLLEQFDLTKKADASFDSLSGGQQRRLALALAFVNDPQVIFLDEPTAGLDPQSRRELHDHINRIKKQGRTIVLSTHYIEEAQSLCDRIAIINSGQIVRVGTPTQLIDLAQLSSSVVITTDPPLAAEQLKLLPAATNVVHSDAGYKISAALLSQLIIQIIKLVDAENCELIDLQIRRASLEDAYLKLVEAGHTSA